MQAWEEKYYEREEGIKEGLEEGIKRGKQKGMLEGLELAKKILRLHREGVSLKEISEECGIPEEQVMQILE